MTTDSDDQTFDVCEVCGCLEWWHRVDDDGWIDAFVCSECGAEVDMAEDS